MKTDKLQSLHLLILQRRAPLIDENVALCSRHHWEKQFCLDDPATAESLNIKSNLFRR